MEGESAKLEGGMCQWAPTNNSSQARLSYKALKIMDNFSVPISSLNGPRLKGHADLALTFENCLLTRFLPQGPLHFVAANPDCFAVASLSLQELQKFAYKFNTRDFHTKTAI